MPGAESTQHIRRSTFLTVLAFTLAASAGVVAFVTWQLRVRLRDRILLHEAEAIRAVAAMQLTAGSSRLEKLGLTDVPGELLSAVLETANLPGVLAVRVFDRDRGFGGAVPVAWSEEPPPPADWATLEAGQVTARWHPRESLALILGLATEPAREEVLVPLVEIWAPLRKAEGAPFLGAVQFWSNGRRLSEEFSDLDTRLTAQALLAWLAGALVTTAASLWAFRKVRVAQVALEARGEDLLRANRELVLAAKTSALGAVTAHLIHELKNPVAGLESFVAGQAESGPRADSGEELAAATRLTRRLRTMIDDVVGVLRDEQHGTQFELTGADVAELALAKVRTVAGQREVTLRVEVQGEFSVAGRTANLAGLVLRNLLQNAVEASAKAGQVLLTGRRAAGGAEFLVDDGGPGLPAHVRERLFQPCASTKEGGSGLGLALSYQLAQQAGGRLELVRSDASGTRFRLTFALER